MAQHLAVCILVLAALCSAASAQVTDTAILQFALNLEYLEANFYHYAAYGRGLSAADRGGGPAAIGGFVGRLSPGAKKYAAALAEDELKHVRFLRAALGASAVPQPLIDIGKAFSGAADAALGAKLSPKFSPYANDILFYHGAYIFEDVGVTAYQGAARFVNNSAYLEAAAGILAVEAYHAGAIRERLYAIKDEFPYPYPLRVRGIVAAISALRQTVSKVADKGIVDAQGNLVIVPADANSITFPRTAAQILSIVYLGGKTKGGFFPQGLNGSIK